MNKKYLYISLAILSVFLIVFSYLWLTKPKNSKSFFLNTVPFLNSTNNPSISPTEKKVFNGEGIPPQTNYKKVANQITDEVSAIEKGKINEFLPIRTENFKTSTPITTTINIFTLETDPRQSIRIEVYGPNFNNIDPKGSDAVAFKESFIEAKASLKKYKLNLNNLQIIYGNRQYIQDTATLWVKEFNLLD